MNRSILVAGIGNIFEGDDFFGVAVVQKLAARGPAPNIRIMDIGIRGIDLAFSLLDEYDLIILIDAVSRGGEPGTLYTLEIGAHDIPDEGDDGTLVNSHGLDPPRVLALAKRMGARFNRLLLVGCEPAVLNRDETGSMGLTSAVESAVDRAVHTILRLVETFDRSEDEKKEEDYICERT